MQGVKVQALESIMVFFRHRDTLSLHFAHKWLMHFGCASGFFELCHAFFGWGFIWRCGAYQWSSSPGRHLGCCGHFVLMCSSLTLFHTDNTSFFFLLLSFGGFRHENYVGMWGTLWVMGVFSRPFSEVSSLTIDIFWWYMLSFYGGLCPIYFSKELGSGGFIFVI